MTAAVRENRGGFTLSALKIPIVSVKREQLACDFLRLVPLLGLVSVYVPVVLPDGAPSDKNVGQLIDFTAEGLQVGDRDACFAFTLSNTDAPQACLRRRVQKDRTRRRFDKFPHIPVRVQIALYFCGAEIAVSDLHIGEANVAIIATV